MIDKSYISNLNKMAEDFELELRMLKTHGYAHNMDEVLLNYRLHEKQITEVIFQRISATRKTQCTYAELNSFMAKS